MATIKSYTSLEQAKELLKILPHQSADMSFNVEKGYEVILHPYMTSNWIGVPCWSLAALLSVLPKVYGLKPILDLEENSIQYSGNDFYVVADNLVDACVAMLLKLKEKNLL